MENLVFASSAGQSLEFQNSRLSILLRLAVLCARPSSRINLLKIGLTQSELS